MRRGKENQAQQEQEEQRQHQGPHQHRGHDEKPRPKPRSKPISKTNGTSSSFADIVSAYTSRFGKDDDQTTVTEEERKKRQGVAAELADSLRFNPPFFSLHTNPYDLPTQLINQIFPSGALHRYYDFASSAYENGWSTHFHYTPFAPHDTIQSAMCFYEHRLAMLMGLKPGMKVLDVGCGIGGPAREIAKFVGCEVVGVTINQAQVDRAIYLTATEGLDGRCTFVRGDFLNLPFPENSFDAAYAIEATVHSPSLEAVYSEIARVLKPGAVFGLSEWVMAPTFDPSNPNHIGIRNRLERGNGLCNLHTSEQARAAMVDAGFSLFHDEDYAQHFATNSTNPGFKTVGNKGDNHSSHGQGRRKQQCQPVHLESPVLVPFRTQPDTSAHSNAQSATHRQHQAYLSSRDSACGLILQPAPPSSIPFHLTYDPHRPWYWPLEGATSMATTWTDYFTAWKMSKWPRRICYALIWTLEGIGIADKGTCDAMTTLAYCVDSAVEGGKEGIFTPCWWFIGRKGSRESNEAAYHQQ
ncbi:Sterol 24-C-methyltransferase [Exophiala dermatitidis]